MDGSHLATPDKASFETVVLGRKGRYKGQVAGVHGDEGEAPPAHGYGSFATPEGYVYSGDWKDNLPDGHGVEVETDGTERVGVWTKGRPAEMERCVARSVAMSSSRHDGML